MRGGRVPLAALLAIAAAPVRAADAGNGFDCMFQARLDAFDHVKLWAGTKGTGFDVPAVQDKAGVFMLPPKPATARVTLHLTDEWPERISVNYFQPNLSPLPLTLLTIFKSPDGGDLLPASISHFTPGPAPADGKIVPTRTVHGLCRLTGGISNQAFINGGQP